MNNYSFYIYDGNCVDNLSLNSAIALFKKSFKKNDGTYLALGVQKGMSCCDLINNLGENNSIRISNDHQHIFQDDKMVQVNFINILKRNFGLDEKPKLNKKKVAVWSITNNSSLNVYDIVHGLDKKMLVGMNNDTPRWHKVYQNSKHYYIVFGGTRWSLNDCMRLN